MSRKRPHKRWLIALGAILALVGLVWLMLPSIVAPIVRSKLEALAATHLDADLQIASLSYSFPYTVRLVDANLRLNRAQRGDLLEIARAELTLDELPLGAGPLLIHSINLDRPTLHLVHGDSHAVAVTQPTMPEPAAPEPKPQTASAPQTEQQKLSDLFRLRRLTLRGGRVVLEDRSRRDMPAMVWDNLSTDLTIDPRSASLYAYQFTTEAPALAELSAEGTFDIDELLLAVDRLALSAHVDTSAPTSPLPAIMSRFAQSYSVDARLKLDASGELPIRNIKSATFDAALRIDDGRARLPQLKHEFHDVSARVSCGTSAAEQLAVRIEKLMASIAGAEVTIAGSRGEVDFAEHRWQLDVPSVIVKIDAVFPSTAPSVASASTGSIEISASLQAPLQATWSWSQCHALARLHEVAIHPHEFESPIHAINGTLRLSDGAVLFERISAGYGQDRLSLKSARLPLEQLPARIVLSDIQSQAQFNPPGPHYPHAVGRVIAHLRPSGSFGIAGSFSIDQNSDDDQWDIVVSSGRGSFDIVEHDIKLDSLRGQATITPELIDMRDITASVCGGALAGAGTVNPSGAVSFGGQFSLADADVNQLARIGPLKLDEKYELVGRAAGAASFSADAATLDALRAEGEISISDGELWEAPVLAHVTREIKVAHEALKASEAAAVFEVADARVNLRHAALYSPALGLQGSGTIGFDGSLNLEVTAALLGDWEQHIKKLRIPLMSDIVGDIAGAMQTAVNTATSTLLYQFHVTGTAAEPHIQPVPAPVLSDAAAMVFEQMLKRNKSMLESMRNRRERHQRNER